MIDIDDVKIVHQILIEKFGGADGIRNPNGLESALARPFATFDNQDLHSTIIDKAAALLESIITNHPFVDGNKRTAYVITRLFLMENGYEIAASAEEKYKMVNGTAEGIFRYEQIREWLINHTVYSK
jgi:death-on-curing protein